MAGDCPFSEAILLHALSYASPVAAVEGDSPAESSLGVGFSVS